MFLNKPYTTNHIPGEECAFLLFKYEKNKYVNFSFED
jgi:hypothetical protein